MSNRSLAVATAAFVVLCGLGLMWTRSSRDGDTATAGDEGLSGQAALVDERPRSTIADDAAPAEKVAAAPPRNAESPQPTRVESAAPIAPSPTEAAEAAAIAGAVREGETRPVGTVDKEHIREAIRSVTPLVRTCFEDAKDRYPAPQKVVLKFTITGQGISGHFTDGEVQESTIVDPWVQSCFLEALTDARFPVPDDKGTVTVTYPFRYENTPPDAGVR